jgi:hypothetical protein
VQGLLEVNERLDKAEAASRAYAEQASRDRVLMMNGLCQLQQQALAAFRAQAREDRDSRNEMMKEVLLTLGKAAIAKQQDSEPEVPDQSEAEQCGQ